jgi:hypothetical protein
VRRPIPPGLLMFPDLTSTGCIFGCGPGFDEMGMSMMPAIPAQGWPSCMAAFARAINGVTRCMTYPRFWPALFGVPVDSRASSAPTDTTGTFDVPGPDKQGLHFRMRTGFR